MLIYFLIDKKKRLSVTARGASFVRITYFLNDYNMFIFLVYQEAPWKFKTFQ